MIDAETADPGRRALVLESALETFARTGYRATSMDAVAREARISRPGLYFLFGSKEALFREAVSYVLVRDLEAVEAVLADVGPLPDRLVAAFDRWAGRYVGPLARDVPGVVADNPRLLDAVAQAAPARFRGLVTAALTGHVTDPVAVEQTLSSVSVGLKHEVDTREAYLTRLRTAVDLLLRAVGRGQPRTRR